MRRHPLEEPSNTEEEILAATYRALIAHGYAGLTVKRIGEEFEKSPSLIYHHYEDKDDLVLACLEFMLDEYAEQLTGEAIPDPKRHLAGMFAWLLTAGKRADDAAFLSLLVDLRSQAVHDTEYRAHFSRSDAVFREHMTDMLQRGSADGTLDIENPEGTAEVLFTLALGTIVRGATAADDGWPHRLRTAIDRYLTA